MADEAPSIVTVALNAAFDRILRVPDLQVGAHVRGSLASVQPAGKATNVARLLGLLGTPCILTGFVGEGDRPRFERSFQGSPVRVEMFEARGATRENITLIDPTRGTETHIRQAGFALTADDLQLSILAGQGAHVVLAGSLPPSMEAETFAHLLEVCQAKGACVAVDSSGPGLAAIRHRRGLWLIKPNREELAEIAGRPVRTEDDVRAAAAALLEHVEQIVVTLGAEGALLVTRDGAWRARPHIGTRAVIKTVGSGDALMAGFVRCHAAGRPAPDCLRYGVACGTAATFQLRAGEISPDDVKACLENVELTAVV
jgi:1-phosphofructokinase family hexose kinase